ATRGRAATWRWTSTSPDPPDRRTGRPRRKPEGRPRPAAQADVGQPALASLSPERSALADRRQRRQRGRAVECLERWVPAQRVMPVCLKDRVHGGKRGRITAEQERLG